MEDVVNKLIDVHGIGKLAPPAKPDHWEKLKTSPATSQINVDVSNRFYRGYSHGEIDWASRVHAIFVDFKGDSMQIGKLLERLSRSGEQYIFVGMAPPFNGGWHFTAVDDFEHPDQKGLDPSWTNIRIWTKVNYVPIITESGEPALTPTDVPDAERKAVTFESRMMSHLYFTGGLMAHTLVANAIGDGTTPLARVVARHLELGATFAAIGHGLDVLISCGTVEKPMIEGFTVATFPGQSNLPKISGLVKSMDAVAQHGHTTGGSLVTASHWCSASADAWFAALGLPEKEVDSSRADEIFEKTTTDPILHWEMSKMPNVDGAVFKGATGDPRIVVFCDDVADTMEIFTCLDKLMEANLDFIIVSGSRKEKDMEVEGAVTRTVSSEVVFGNAMYPLRDCLCTMQSIPADFVRACFKPTAFFAVGGQCPYRMIEDPPVMSIIDNCDIGCAVCHGPEVMVGTKWLKDGESFGKFTSYYGAWVSFRDVFARYEKKKPGEITIDSSGRLITGNAPNSSPAWADAGISAIKAL